MNKLWFDDYFISYRSKVYLWSTSVCECLIQCSHRALNPSREKLPRAWRGASRTCEPVHCYRNSFIHRNAIVVAFLPPPLPRHTLFACEGLIKIWNSQLAITAHCDFLTRIFVGNNKNSAGYYLYAEQFTVFNPWFHCSSHSFAKSHNVRLLIC